MSLPKSYRLIINKRKNLQNRLFVVNKPINISSNSYLYKIKKKYKVKKAGFSGTLDPFANGCLIVAFGQYSKLFRFLQKTPKKYRATIWLGVQSSSLDLENIISIEDEKKLQKEMIIKSIESFKGEIKYTPPKFSAKRVDGKRAYELARDDIEFELKESVMNIYDIRFISYMHPFITFEASVSEGSYIRSLAQFICDKLEVKGTLSYLQRVNEGKFFYDKEKALNPLEYIDLPIARYSGSKEWISLGKKLDISYFECKENGVYLLVFDDFFSIIEILNEEIKYILNKVML